MVWMTGVLRWRGATARIHAELALIGIDIPGPVFSGHDSSFRAAARGPAATGRSGQAPGRLLHAVRNLAASCRRETEAQTQSPRTCHHQETAVRHAQRSIQHRRQTTESRTIGATPIIERDIPLPVVRQTAFPNARRSRAQWESWGPAPSGSLQEGCMKGMFGSWPKRLRRSDRGR